MLEHMESTMWVMGATSIAFQLFIAFTLQVIADKQGQTELTRFLAWIPGLNVYTVVKCGRGSFPRFLIVGIGGAVATGVLLALLFWVGGEGIGGLAYIFSTFIWILGALYYFGLLSWRMAESRDLSGWFGILAMIPVLNLFFFPYIAFHDGWGAPNKAGLAVGFLAAAVPVGLQIGMMNMMTNAASSEFAAAMNEAGIEGEGGAEMQQAFEAMGVAMEIGMELARISELDPSDPAQAEEMRSAIAGLRQRLDEQGHLLGDDGQAQFDQALAEIDGMLAGGGRPLAMDTGAEMALDEMGDGALDEIELAGDSGTGDAGEALDFDIEKAAPPAALDDSVIPVAAEGPCPPGSSLLGGEPPEAFERWCSREGIRHGLYEAWHADGRTSASGEYWDGLRVGEWTRWYDNGQMRVRAHFREGLQDGRMMAWDRDGNVAVDVVYRGGEPVGTTDR